MNLPFVIFSVFVLPGVLLLLVWFYLLFPTFVQFSILRTYCQCSRNWLSRKDIKVVAIRVGYLRERPLVGDLLINFNGGGRLLANTLAYVHLLIAKLKWYLLVSLLLRFTSEVNQTSGFSLSIFLSLTRPNMLLLNCCWLSDHLGNSWECSDLLREWSIAFHYRG